MPEILQFAFMDRAFVAGIIIGVIAPLAGTFLVIRRYSLIADSLAHVSLAGIALGLFTGFSPVATALGTALIAGLGIDRLRAGKQVTGDAGLAMLLSGGLALAVVLIGLAHGFNAGLLSYLFGSITTVQASDLWTIVLLGIGVIGLTSVFYKELLYTSFDEEAARISGLPTRWMNRLLVAMTVVTVVLSIPIVGALLIGALMVIPVVTATQIARSFRQSLWLAMGFSLLAVVSGLVLAYYLDLAAGGTIVLCSLVLFGLAMAWRKWGV